MAKNSIVDFLKDRGQDSSFQARKQMAQEQGIENFTGTAAQNTQLLNRLRSNNSSQRGVISAPGIETATPLKIPAFPVGQASRNITSSIRIPEAPVQTAPSPENQALLKSIGERQAILEELGLGDIKDTFEELQGKGDFTARAEDAAGISTKTEALNEINNQIRETDLAFRRDREELQDQTGMTADFKNQSLSALADKQARRLADLSIVQSSLNNDLATAQALVDRKVELEFEPIEQRLQFQQSLYQENKDIFNTVEQRQFEEKVREEEAKLAEDKFKFQQLENLKLDQLNNMRANGAPVSAMNAVQSAGTIGQVFSAAGSYGMSLQERKAKLEIDDLVEASIATASFDPEVPQLTEKQRKDLVNSKNAQKAISLIDVARVLEDYEAMITGFGKTPTRAQRAKAKAYLDGIVAPSMSVAVEQGAMTDDEARRNLDNFGLKGIRKREKVTFGNVATAISGFKTKINTQLEAVDSVVPGATDAIDIFSNYKISGLEGADKESAIIKKEVNAFRSGGFTDSQILESQVDPDDLDIALSLLSQGYPVADIINELK